MIRLEPNRKRLPILLIPLALLPLPILAYIYQAYVIGDGKQADQDISYAIPCVLMPLMLYFYLMFVPGVIEFSELEFTRISRFSGKQTFSWKDLKAYGEGDGFYLIQFGDKGALHITPTSYDKEDWAKLINFLTSHYPERKAIGYVNDRLFTKKDKENLKADLKQIFFGWYKK